jgi:hypothetical protein
MMNFIFVRGELEREVGVLLIPFLRKLITDKAETPPVEAATVVPVA